GRGNPGGRLGHGVRVRHRRRHQSRSAGLRVRRVPPGAQLDDTPLRRNRSRPRDLEAPGDTARRPHLGRQRGRARKQLPLHAADPRSCRRRDRDRRAHRGDALMARVLVVEDDANYLDVASRIIRASGHEALVAVDGVAGLDLARVERPDAILVDLLLPRMDGWSLTRSLRTEPWAASIPIIAVSALALPSDRARAIEAGRDDL